MAPKILAGVALVVIVLALFATAEASPALRYSVAAIALLAVVAVAAYLVPAAQTQSAGTVASSVTDAPIAPSLTRILDALPVGVLTIGADGKIGIFNAAAGEIFGVAIERAPGRALIEIVRNFELDRRVGSALREGLHVSTEITHSGAHDRRLHVTTHSLDSDLGDRGVLVIVADLTRMRELEKLRQEFVSNVSHELRTPLTAVKLMVETLQTGVESRDRDQFLASIAAETDRMITLVEDLLDLARLESGKLELRLSTVDIRDLCRQAAAAQRARAESAQVDLVVSTPPNPMSVSADRDKLYQVVTNLLDNALRHTPEHGTVTLSMSARNGSVNIEVADTGSGIPSRALPHIFERFYVVDPARARSRSGTGLGLAIVKHIIEAHGGSVAAESELGAGSVFRCSLPAGLQASEPVI